MSQTETLMLVALGFVAASFIALVLGRVLWKLARRLDRRRRDSQVPTVVAGLEADRERLRAELAMQSRKVDVRLGEMKARLAEQMAEVSRHRNRLELLAEEFHKREAALAERENEREGMRAQPAPLESELAKRTETSQALKQQLRDKDETITRPEREVVELRDTVAGQHRQ